MRGRWGWRSGAENRSSSGPERRRGADLARLAEAVEAIESRTGWKGGDDDGGEAASGLVVPTGWGFGESLERGAIHEWFTHTTTPPLSLLVHLARQALRAAVPGAHPCVFWIGRRVWPHPLAMVERGACGAHRHGTGASSSSSSSNEQCDFDEARRLLERSVFVRTSNHDEHVWAVDLALRCAGAAAVIADGRRLRMAESRRLQLAAAASGALGLLARPADELGSISAARTRWLASCEPSPDDEPRWSVELLRCKGVRPSNSKRARRWVVQRDHETGDVGVVSDAADRSAAADGSPERIAQRWRRRTA